MTISGDTSGEISWQVIGHAPVKRILEQQLTAAVFPHAYLFIGLEGVGKQALAKEFAAKILQVDHIKAHPDVHIVDAATADFEIDSTRQLTDRLSLTPLSGNRTVAIIDNADQLTVQSSNALLKTLEEPSPHTIMILIAGNGNVLPTVKSRCQVYNFGALTTVQLEQFAAALPARPEQKLMQLSSGSPGRLHYLSQHPEESEQLAQLVDRLDNLMRQSLAERFAAIPDLADTDDALLKSGLRSWLSRLRRVLHQKSERFILMSAILESLRSLEQSMNRKLVLQRLFTSE